MSYRLYPKLDQTINAMNFKKNLERECNMIYQKDIHVQFAGEEKRFLVSNDKLIYESIIKKSDDHLYEWIREGNKFCLIFDFDIFDLPKIVDDCKINQKVCSVIDKVTKYFNENFKINISMKDFIFLRSKYCDKKKKHSIHGKLTKYYFSNYRVAKYYFKKFELKKEDGVDESIYRVGSFRLAFCSKINQDRPLLPYRIKDSIYYDDKYRYLVESKVTYAEGYKKIPQKEYDNDMKKKKEERQKWKNKTTVVKHTTIDREEIEEYLNILGSDKYDERNKWLKIGMILKNTSEEYFELFDEFSKKSVKYKGIEDVKKTWDTINIEHNKKIGIGTLKFWAKQDNEELYETINQKSGFNFAKIMKYIKDEKNQDGIIANHYRLLHKIVCYMNKYITQVNNNGMESVYLIYMYKTYILKSQKGLHDIIRQKISWEYVGDDNKTLRYPVKGDIRVVTIWLESEFRNQKNRIVFEPNVNTRNNKNIYTGIPVTREIANLYKNINITPLKDHILNIWCKGNKVHYEYTTKLLASYLQNIGNKPGVSLVIKGDKGTGKSLPIEIFVKIFGEYGDIIKDINTVTGNFNSALANKIVLYINECTFTGNNKETNILRGLINGDKFQINKKFQQPITISNHVNFIIDGNNERLVSNVGKERRYFLLETDNKWAGIETAESKAYFDPIANIPPEAIANWLYNIDLTNFYPRRIPDTQTTMETRVLSFDKVEEFVHNLIDDGTHEIFNTFIKLEDIYEEFKRNAGTGFTQSSKQFKIKFKKITEYEEKLCQNRLMKIRFRGVKLKSREANIKKMEDIFGKLIWQEKLEEIEIIEGNTIGNPLDQ